MTIDLTPEDENLVQKRLRTGVFRSAEEVIHRALEAQEAEEGWLLENRASVNEKIERGLAQFERGEGLSGDAARERLEVRKTAWRAEQRGG